MKQIWLIALTLLALMSCKKADETPYPEVVWEFTELHTDVKGVATTLFTDTQQTYKVAVGEPLIGFPKKDTTIRAICIYELPASKEIPVRLYDAVTAFAPIPIPIGYFKKGVSTDPVYLRSIWKTERYINLILDYLARDKGHLFHFADAGITQEETHQTLHILIYHNQNEDYPAFRKTVYMSVPVYPYSTRLKKGVDQIEITVNTIDKGVIKQRFTY